MSGERKKRTETGEKPGSIDRSAGHSTGNSGSKPTTKPFDLFSLFCLLFWGAGKRSIWGQFLFATLIFGALFLLWRQMALRVTSSADYRLGRRQIVILDPPPWIPPTFVDEATESLREEGSKDLNLDITDPELSDRLYLAFDAHPWVRRVVSIEKEFPARILVRLEFRKPLALVEVSASQYRNEQAGGLFQIDDEGVLLPTDYLRAQALREPNAVYDYLWIRGVESIPMGSAGEPWSDPLINEAALLAEFLTDDYRSLQIRRIVVRRESEERPGGVFDLETIRNTKIHWGTFPLTEAGGVGALTLSDSTSRLAKIKADLFRRDAPKLDYLRKMAKRYGSLDDLPADQTPLDISDLRKND